MNYNKMSVRDADLNGKKVLLRCDFNVPQDKETGAITSDKRIVAALPTIQYLLDNGAAVIACSHLGKPKGTWKESLTLAPVAKRLSELGYDVQYAPVDTQGVVDIERFKALLSEKDTKHPLLKDFDSPFDINVELYF